VGGAVSVEWSAAVLAALAAAGALLVTAGLRGAPAAPVPMAGIRRRWWRSGTARTTVDRRRRRALLMGSAAAGATTLLVTGVVAAALLAAAAVPALPWLWNAGAAERRAVARAEAVGQWTGRLRDRLGTGTGLVAAIVESVDTAPPPVREQVRALAQRVRGGGRPAEALRLFADELDDAVADQVVAALLLHLEDRGEHLSEVLAALGADAAQAVSMRREVHARRAQSRMTVRFMIVLAGVVTAAMGLVGLLPVYGTASGQVVLLVLAGGFAAVLAWVHTMSSPPAPQRFLAPAVGGRA
jgi:Flp pilus assembly protein TadB